MVKKMILERKYSQADQGEYYFPQIYLGENQMIFILKYQNLAV